jgi:8-oxo-dGTP pyrophosphatase MutT (NUDIX family)
VFNSERKVLLTRRSALVREPGKWCLPGGHFDGGENWINAMRREMLEETGIKVTSEVLVGIYSDPTLTVTAEVVREGYRGQFLVASFLVISYDGEIVPNEEVDQWGWFDLERLPTPILKSHPIRIVDALNFSGNVFVR